jgi:hypothetical protein
MVSAGPGLVCSSCVFSPWQVGVSKWSPVIEYPSPIRAMSQFCVCFRGSHGDAIGDYVILFHEAIVICEERPGVGRRQLLFLHQ